MDVLSGVFQVLGDAVNGILQVVADFLNLVIDVLPNPDPFRDMIENLDVSTAADLGFVTYWLDALIGIDASFQVISLWAGLMVGAAVFAVVYWVVKAIKP